MIGSRANLPRAALVVTAAVMAGTYVGLPASHAAQGRAQGQGALAFSRCARAHGVSRFPNAGKGMQLATVSAKQAGVSSARFLAAETGCEHLLPTGSSLLQQREYDCIQNSDCPPALTHRILRADHEFAACMRSHGWPTFPNPTTDANGPWFDITKAGISDARSHSHGFMYMLDLCERLIGENAPQAFG